MYLLEKEPTGRYGRVPSKVGRKDLEFGLCRILFAANELIERLGCGTGGCTVCASKVRRQKIGAGMRGGRGWLLSCMHSALKMWQIPPNVANFGKIAIMTHY